MTRHELLGGIILVLDSILTDEECKHLIAWTEQQGYQDNVERDQKGSPGEGPAFACCSAVPDGLAKMLQSRTAPAVWPGADGVRLEQLGFLRFDPGQRLPPGYGCRSGDEAPGQTTLLVSLNSNFKGGETLCYPFAGPVSVPPEPGKALLFPAYLNYEEMPVRHGRKYVLCGQMVQA